MHKATYRVHKKCCLLLKYLPNSIIICYFAHDFPFYAGSKTYYHP